MYTFFSLLFSHQFIYFYKKKKLCTLSVIKSKKYNVTEKKYVIFQQTMLQLLLQIALVTTRLNSHR